MHSYDSFDRPEVIKKYILKYLIKNINKIDNNYLNCCEVLLKIDDEFKAKLLILLKETQKQNK